MVRRGVVARLALAAVLLVVAALAVVPRFVSWRSDNTIRRGQRIARREGCLNCHQAPFRGELGNPGSGTGSVPALGSGSLMMYVQRPEEVEEWIRDGQSRALAANPEALEKYRAQLLQMPPFGEKLSAVEISALRAFVVAADGYISPAGEKERQGEIVAREHCLACHNVGGAGGLHNPGSYFGYIPGLWGSDFEDLVRDKAELREWIQTGASRRVGSLPLAAWVTRKQQIKMPAYGEHLEAEEIDALVAYIGWLGRSRGATVEIP